jgi:hypothetical protein
MISSEKLRAWEEFARRIVDAGAVWSVTNDNGPLAAQGVDGTAAQPFWSNRRSADRMIEKISVKQPARIVRISLEEFVSRILVTLADADVLVGVDWAADGRGWVFHAVAIRRELRRLIRLRLN